MGKNLTFDLLPPANKNFQNITLSSVWSSQLVLKSCKIFKKSNEAFLKYFEKTSFLYPKWAKKGAWGRVRIFFKNLTVLLFLLYWCLTSCKILENPMSDSLDLCKGRTDKRTNGRTSGWTRLKLQDPSASGSPIVTDSRTHKHMHICMYGRTEANL